MIKKLKPQEGFTLIEMLFVIIMLGVFAVALIPVITSSTEDAKLKTLSTSISRLRHAIDLYYLHHNDTYPGAKNIDGGPIDSAAIAANAFVAQLTQYTRPDGKVSESRDDTYIFGPYITADELPMNPFNYRNDLTCDISTTGISGRNNDSSTGWKFYTQTGVIMANDGKHGDI